MIFEQYHEIEYHVVKQTVHIFTGFSGSKVIICIGNSGSNPERASCR